MYTLNAVESYFFLWCDPLEEFSLFADLFSGCFWIGDIYYRLSKYYNTLFALAG